MKNRFDIRFKSEVNDQARLTVACLPSGRADRSLRVQPAGVNDPHSRSNPVYVRSSFLSTGTSALSVSKVKYWSTSA